MQKNLEAFHPILSEDISKQDPWKSGIQLVGQRAATKCKIKQVNAIHNQDNTSQRVQCNVMPYRGMTLHGQDNTRLKDTKLKYPELFILN